MRLLLGQLYFSRGTWARMRTCAQCVTYDTAMGGCMYGDVPGGWAGGVGVCCGLMDMGDVMGYLPQNVSRLEHVAPEVQARDAVLQPLRVLQQAWVVELETLLLGLDCR
eukprot:3850199-Rhodomonas_salina.1